MKKFTDSFRHDRLSVKSKILSLVSRACFKFFPCSFFFQDKIKHSTKQQEMVKKLELFFSPHKCSLTSMVNFGKVLPLV